MDRDAHRRAPPETALTRKTSWLNAAAYIERIEQEARADPGFAFALSSVWLWHGVFPPEIEERLSRATNGKIQFFEPSAPPED